MRKFVFEIPNRYESREADSGWKPTVDTVKTTDGYVVCFDLPGVDPERVDISVEENVLTVSGERGKKFEPTAADEWYSETTYGKFARRLELPKGVDSDAIRATYEHGVLELKIPVVGKPAARKIPVTVDSAHTASKAA